MQVMGTNTWEFEVDTDQLIGQALSFSERVKEQGIARLLGAWISPEHRMLWCSWETDDVEALQRAFDEMNAQSGLKSELSPMRAFYPG